MQSCFAGRCDVERQHENVNEKNKEDPMSRKCVHSCKGLCSALEVAELREQEAITQYRQYATECDYPDVQKLLEALIADRERAIRLLREKREMLSMKFSVVDRINDSFA